MEKTDPLLRISHVRKSFGTLEVLKDISIDVYKGDVVSILGPSGSGKTTLLRCINFLERADGGSITLDDTTIDLKAATREQENKPQRFKEKPVLFSRTTTFSETKLRSRILPLA